MYALPGTGADTVKFAAVDEIGTKCTFQPVTTTCLVRAVVAETESHIFVTHTVGITVLSLATTKNDRMSVCTNEQHNRRKKETII